MRLNKKIKLLIAADGGAGSGKTTGSKLIAKKYNLKLLSSGLLYRYVAYKLLRTKKIKLKNYYLKRLTKNINLNDVKKEKLYSIDVTELASKIAKIKMVRNLLKNYQKKFAKNRHVIIEGRDIGTVIVPHADLKLFFVCPLNVKAKRRFKEYRKTNKGITLNEVKKSIKLRDLVDKKRKISPLRPAKGAVTVDTSKVNKKQMLIKLSKIVEDKLKEKYGRNL